MAAREREEQVSDGLPVLDETSLGSVPGKLDTCQMELVSRRVLYGRPGASNRTTSPSRCGFGPLSGEFIVAALWTHFMLPCQDPSAAWKDPSSSGRWVFIGQTNDQKGVLLEAGQ